MVMKSQLKTEKQKPHQLHRLQSSHRRDPLVQRQSFAEEATGNLRCCEQEAKFSSGCSRSHFGDCSSNSNNQRQKDDTRFSEYKFGNAGDVQVAGVVNPAGKKVPFKGSVKRCKVFQSGALRNRLALVLVVVISLLADKLVHGANVNSTLAVDLLMNSNRGVGATSDESINSIVTSTSTTTTTTTTGSSSSISNETISTNTTVSAIDDKSEELSGATTLPPFYDNDSKSGNLNISYDQQDNTTKTTTPLPPYTSGDRSSSSHINVTLPIQVTPDSTVIVKQGSIIYEVINNGTVTTNIGTFTIPIITTGTARGGFAGVTASPELDPRMRVYQQMTATVLGLRVEETAKGVSYKDGASKILANSAAVIRFFGLNFTVNTIIRFVSEDGERGVDCDDVSSSKYYFFESEGLTQHSAVAKVNIRALNDGERMFYVCVRENNTDMPWVHQGMEPWIIITTYEKWLPFWAHVLLLMLLLALSGLFSGLNLGLMAIDRTELKIIINAGSEQDRRYAKKIKPLRDNGNYLLCSLLLGNVLVNATLTILLDDLTSGLIAVIGSTVGIVILGEIVPQAICSRHGLAVGAKTVLLTKFFMAVTFPLSYPISVILNKVLGEEIGNVYNRDRLKELVRITQDINDLEKDEVNIIEGALELKQKTVVDVMTRLEDVYMLPIDAVLDFDTVSEIMNNGYSRVPVYEGYRGNVVSLLYAKDLAFVDPDDKMPLRTICEFYSNPCHFVFENVTLNVLFNVFKQGNKGHMAFVQRVKSSDKVDPSYEVIGLVTMEDVIEELIQEEINDETDVWDFEAGKRRSQGNYCAITEIALPMPHLKTEGTTVSPQLTLAAFQYLSTAVEEFQDSTISKPVLERLLKQNIYFHIKFKVKDSTKIDPSTILYERGKPADYFVMILEGRVLAEIGKESLVFESGPFTYFGTKCLLVPPVGDAAAAPAAPTALVRKTSQISQTSYVSQISEAAMLPTFIPDYTVRAITDLTYFQISRSMYLAAKQATLLEKSYSSTDSGVGDEKIDEQTKSALEEVLEASDGKSKETSIAMAKSTGRGSISEKHVKGWMEGSRNIGLVSVPPAIHQQQLKQQVEGPVIGDNNNVCKGLPSNGELVTDQREELARVILCPVDETPPAKEL